MSRPSDEELVRVTSLEELAAGMTVWSTKCGRCGKTHVYTLIAPAISLQCHHLGEADPGVGCHVWKTVPGHVHLGGRLCFAQGIRDGRLFRLKPESDASQETTSRTREMEGVR